MMTTMDALKALYVALGGSADEVADMVLIPDLIYAIAELKEAEAANGAEAAGDSNEG